MSIGDYNIIKPLGKGTYGETYLVQKDGQEYAIKYYKGPDPMRDLSEEKTLLQAITTICNEYSACYIDEILNSQGNFIVMTYLAGISVKDAIFSDTLKIPYETRIQSDQIIKDLILGLNAIHSLGLIHQDIKPDNLIYNPDTGRTKYIDFGLSCILNDDIEVAGQPVFSSALKFPCGSHGTPITSSPEMYTYGSDGNILYFHSYENGVRKSRPKMDNYLYPAKYLVAHDIWSVGCVLLSWYTNPATVEETQYPITVLPKTKRELDSLDILNDQAYYIIYGLMNRIIDLRIQNFNNIVVALSSFFSTQAEITAPNLMDKTVTLSERAILKQWRCRIRRPFIRKYVSIPQYKIDDVIGETKNSCTAMGKRISLTINDQDGSSKTVEANTFEDVGTFKYRIDEQNLYLNGINLPNDAYLYEYDIKDGDVLTNY